MSDWTLRTPWAKDNADRTEPLLSREWLVGNGLGGYASGTLAGVASRRYHSLLNAALPALLGRQNMLNHLTEFLRFPDGSTLRFGGEESPKTTTLDLHGAEYLKSFRLEFGLPVWRYEAHGFALEKRVFLPHQQNSVYVNYRLVEGEGTVRLKLRPAVHFRPHDAPVSDKHLGPYTLTWQEDRFELSVPTNLPPLRLYLHGQRGAFTLEGKWLPNVLYRTEEELGYESIGDLWSPGYFRADLTFEHEVTLVGSTEKWDTVLALKPAEALEAERGRRQRLLSAAHPTVRTGPARELVFAADQFIITPEGRVEEAARARAAGDEVRTVIAGYHWFTDWGRDTMISLEGLTLTTGRQVEAGYILRTFAHYVRDGLIPNLFPEGEREGLYHTADATLWFFHALHRYGVVTKDRALITQLLPKLVDIIDYHLRGTRFGIGVDPEDGLLRQGQEGYQLTWMDAKVGDWVVTPRRGKAVEINALWYNALRLMETWVRADQGEQQARPYAHHADRACRAFNARFWNKESHCLYDVVDGEGGNDPACRPNQILAIALEHSVLDKSHWEPVLDVVVRELLTPVGLRSLSPRHPDFKAKYFGNLRARDAAYHQGTVWCWLIGPFIDAWIRVHPEDREGARRFLQGFEDQQGEACVGSISEICDAETPFTPRGCVTQAWSVAEVLRGWAKTAPGDYEPNTHLGAFDAVAH